MHAKDLEGLDLSALQLDDEEHDLLSAVWSAARPFVLQRGVLDEGLHRYKDDPVGFGRDILGRQYWAGQEAILRALVKHKRVTVRSCRKAGKTQAAADIVNWFSSTAPSIVVTTAPGGQQVRDLMWERIRSGRVGARKRLPGRCMTTEIRVAEDWYAVGFSTDNPENFLGYHAGVIVPGHEGQQKERRLLFVFDESPGIEQFIFDALKGSLSGDNVYVLLLGNPSMDEDDPHEFPRSHKPGSGYHRIRIAATDPAEPEAFIRADEEFVGVPDWLIKPEWIDERRKEWPPESMLWLGHVCGQFGRGESSNLLFVPRWILQAAAAREGTFRQAGGERHIGVDVGAGGDPSVASLVVGGLLVEQKVWNTPNLMETAHRIEGLIHVWADPVTGSIAGENIHIDNTGVGKGVVDRLKERGYDVDGVDFGAAARYAWRDLTGQMLFKNAKAELFWIARRCLEEGKACVPPSFVDVWAQAGWHGIKERPATKGTELMCRETKDEQRARWGRSPDHWDSWALTFSRGGALHEFASEPFF